MLVNLRGDLAKLAEQADIGPIRQGCSAWGWCDGQGWFVVMPVRLLDDGGWRTVSVGGFDAMPHGFNQEFMAWVAMLTVNSEGEE